MIGTKIDDVQFRARVNGRRGLTPCQVHHWPQRPDHDVGWMSPITWWSWPAESSVTTLAR